MRAPVWQIALTACWLALAPFNAPSKSTTWIHSHPAAINFSAEKFIAAGCEWIHVVDLDGALKGASANQQAVNAICQTGARIQLGGGIRTMQDIENWLSAGISRVVLGTIALKNPKLVIKAAKAFPGQEKPLPPLLPALDFSGRLYPKQRG